MIFNGASEKIIQKIIAGLVKVGNAKKLDGHGAEYFAPLSYFANRQLTKNVLNTVDEINAFYNELHANALDTSVYEGWVAHNVGHSILGDGQFYVWGTRTNSLYGWQKAINYSNNLKEYERALNNGTWGEWKEVFTTDGGTIAGKSIELYNGFGRVHNSYDSVSLLTRTVANDDKNGVVLILYNENTNTQDWRNKAFLVTVKDGVNVFQELLHTGNMASHVLPLYGGGVVRADRNFPVGVMNTLPNAKEAYIVYSVEGKNLGYLGFYNVDNPVFVDSNGIANSLLHTGNSAKVVPDTVAPSDTTAVWIDTSD